MIWNKITEEQNPVSSHIDEAQTSEILNIINSEDLKVPFAVQKILPEIEIFIENLFIRIIDGGQLYYVGSGTSGRLGVLDAAECPPTYSTDPKMIQGIIAGGPDALISSIEGAEDHSSNGAKAIIDKRITKIDTVLGITASSTTPFVLGALEEAKKIGALTGLIICNKPSDIDYVDHFISIIVGPEVITGSTRMKAGTATKLVLNMITTTLMVKLNKTYGNLMVDLKVSNQKLLDRGTRIIELVTELDHENSLKLLHQANGEVKTAIVMEKKKCTYDEGVKMLNIVNGSLKQALEM